MFLLGRGPSKTSAVIAPAPLRPPHSRLGAGSEAQGPLRRRSGFKSGRFGAHSGATLASKVPLRSHSGATLTSKGSLRSRSGFKKGRFGATVASKRPLRSRSGLTKGRFGVVVASKRPLRSRSGLKKVASEPQWLIETSKTPRTLDVSALKP